jgi:hypothetical protein
MAEAPRSNRPPPRTPAAVEAELRRRIRSELQQARSEVDGQLGDAELAAIIARAVAAAWEWHLTAPEHTRNATLSSRTWRPAAGPRGGSRREEEADRPPPPRSSRPREFDRGPRDFDEGERGPREFDARRRQFDRGPREYEQRGPRGGGTSRGGGFKRGGGFGPRRPPRPR